MKYLFILLICLFFSSCELTHNDVYHKLPDKYKNIINKDTLLYQSNSNIDSLFIRKITDATFQYALSGTSCKQPYEYWEFEYLYYFKENVNDNHCVSWFDLKEYGECAGHLPECEHAIRIRCGIKGYQPIVYFNKIIYECTDTIDNIICDGLIFNNIYEYEAQSKTSKYTKIYINYKNGLLKYTSNNMTYELKNNLSK